MTDSVDFPVTADFRHTEREQERIRDLLELIPPYGDSILDVGARDGYLSRRLVGRFARVVALDLAQPEVRYPGVEAVAGDAAALAYPDDAFDTVVCAEVLEHIASADLARACSELARVARRAVVIGVPYRQDLRYGETLCRSCQRPNPPWGHLNAFDEERIRSLFVPLQPAQVTYVGTNRDATNALAAGLMRYAGNPYGTYDQDEPCVHCGAALQPPAPRSFLQKVATKVAYRLERAQQSLVRERASWIHVRFDKPSTRDARSGG
jgi:ubiquinone/menaquinone biosynthesis C-methylase UbiE